MAPTWAEEPNMNDRLCQHIWARKSMLFSYRRITFFGNHFELFLLVRMKIIFTYYWYEYTYCWPIRNAELFCNRIIRCWTTTLSKSYHKLLIFTGGDFPVTARCRRGWSRCRWSHTTARVDLLSTGSEYDHVDDHELSGVLRASRQTTNPHQWLIAGNK